jgi:uncharacterized protein YraI
MVCALWASAQTAVVVGDRINLRAAPSKNAEVTVQVGNGQSLTVKSVSNGWVAVRMPESADVYVHRDFVKDGVATVSPLNLRAGPGINYNRVGSLSKGDAVAVRGEVGEWLKIVPPPVATAWVSEDYVRIDPGTPPPPPPAPVVPAVADASPVARVAPPTGMSRGADDMPSPPEGLSLAPVARQGLVVLREGRIYVPTLSFGRPSKFQFLSGEGNAQKLVCYLRGNAEQLAQLEGRCMRIRGREYWVQGCRHPLVVVEQIMLIPD